VRTDAVEPDVFSSRAEDDAAAAADTLVLTIPNQLGVDTTRPSRETC